MFLKTSIQSVVEKLYVSLSFQKAYYSAFLEEFCTTLVLHICSFGLVCIYRYAGDVCSQKGLLKTETEEIFSLNFLCGNLHVKDTVGFLCSITRTRGRKQSNKIHRFYKVVCQVNYRKIEITVVYVDTCHLGNI